MSERIHSLPAEHEIRGDKRIPLCSRVARKNLGLLLGVPRKYLAQYEVYRDLTFAPFGRALDVHRIYQKGWKSDKMVGSYISSQDYGQKIWNPPQGAIYADLFFSTPAGHRCIAFMKSGQWYILDPYFHNGEIVTPSFPFPFETYCALLYFLRGCTLEGAAFYRE